jgi:hypothetical protein
MQHANFASPIRAANNNVERQHCQRRKAAYATPMTEPILFDRSFFGAPGELIRLSSLVRRMVAGNPGPMTFMGTCTYVLGHGEVTIIDPGPDNKEHIASLLEALSGETVATILVTHTHQDHSPAARALKAATGARIVGCAPTQCFGSPIDAADDFDYVPDTVMHDGDAIEAKNFSLLCVATPGHTRNHLLRPAARKCAVFRRSCHGLVNFRRRAPGRRDARLHGLAW